MNRTTVETGRSHWLYSHHTETSEWREWQSATTCAV